ncbi:hypothetical protein DL96DRAFT_1052548 [Flagelloscypha sp. PMI_526]|nr:hypothetical protein DL96DRAFT_1052548 [Flagelloscypha sp. PMI_526]
MANLEHSSSSGSSDSRTTDYFLSRDVSADTNESPFGSVLTTPDDLDEEFVASAPRIDDAGLKKIVHALEEHHKIQASKVQNLATTPSEESHLLYSVNAQEPSLGLPLPVRSCPGPGTDNLLDSLERQRCPHNRLWPRNLSQKFLHPPKCDAYSASRGTSTAKGLPLLPSVYQTLKLSPCHKFSSASDLQNMTFQDEDITFRAPEGSLSQPGQDLESYIDPSAFRLPGYDTPLFTIPDLPTLTSFLSLDSLVKTISFLPWCALIGASIILFPKHVSFFAFNPTLGFVDIPTANEPIRRFEHFSELGSAYLLIFLGSLVLACLGLGLESSCILVGWVIAQGVLGWRDFRYDDKIVLGTDDQQSLYLAIWKGYDIVSETETEIVRIPEGFLLRKIKMD